MRAGAAPLIAALPLIPALRTPLRPAPRLIAALRLLAALGVLAAAALPAAAAGTDEALQSAVSSSARNPAAVARDKVRHPVEELTFFGLKPNMTVVELWPGGGYWTDILAPYLAPRGHYYVALSAPGNPDEDAGIARFKAHLASDAARFGAIHLTTLGAGHYDIAPRGSADLVLTFRNVHNWMDEGYVDEALKACFAALKPGGVLGVEEHRGDAHVTQDPKAANGYVRQDYMIALAKKAGFVLEASSEIDANPRDTKDYPKGVWTLPPSYAEGDKDRAKYEAIGEADNFVLKFRKPR
jgi:predicted methyltransferase